MYALNLCDCSCSKKNLKQLHLLTEYSMFLVEIWLAFQRSSFGKIKAESKIMNGKKLKYQNEVE